MNYEMFAWLSGETFAAGVVRGTTRFLAVTLPAAAIYVAPVYAGAVLADESAAFLADRSKSPGVDFYSPEIVRYEHSAFGSSRLI